VTDQQAGGEIGTLPTTIGANRDRPRFAGARWPLSLSRP
jgi:hypothetical protein